MNDRRPVILWFTRDLRLADNPALNAALETGHPVLPIFILDEETAGTRLNGGATQWWLHHSLVALDTALGIPGASLVLRRGPTVETLLALARETGAAAIHWTRGYESGHRAAEETLREAAASNGLTVRRYPGRLLFEPETIRTKQSGPYRVFTPFWRNCRDAPPPAIPVSAPKRWPAHAPTPRSDVLNEWRLLPDAPNWAEGLEKSWHPGETGARVALNAFLDDKLDGYSECRDRPDRDGISRLSPHLAFGEISPRQVWHAARSAADRGDVPEAETLAFLREIGWRDFAHHILFDNSDVASRPLDSRFTAFPWRDAPEDMAAWQKGRTGFPIVDAGMRELWETGFMHNRVRMIAASFLVKDLMLPWQAGEAWFWDTLVDACPANNPHNWQWVAGCGTDASPFFRIFNPVIQARRFDPDGAYIRRWVPELAGLTNRRIHAPWEASAEELREAGLRLGESYPRPILDHTEARRRALAAFDSIKERKA